VQSAGIDGGDPIPIGLTVFEGNEDLAMSQNRVFARVKPGGRVSNTAKIVTALKAPVIECMVVDYSAGGACLQLLKYTDLPERFDMLYGTTKKRCRVLWKRALRVGVAF
jgi:hypothetical protein